MLQTASYITGLSPKAIEMLASHNLSDWAMETGWAKHETSSHRTISNKLLEDENCYHILSLIAQYFANVERTQDNIDLAAYPELANALSVLDRYGYRVLSRRELLEMNRQAITKLIDKRLQNLSRESQ